MRTNFFLAMGLLTCVGLSGCDNAGNNPTASAQTATPPCDCQKAAAAPAEATPARRTHRQTWDRSSYAHHEYGESDRYPSASSSRTYYQSESEDHSYDQSEFDDRSGYDDRSDYREEAENSDRNGGGFWIDGYGRRHYYAAAVAAAQPPDDRVRRDPWRGYDETYDDDKDR